MAEREYADFDLVIEAGESGDYSTRVTGSPAGEALGQFRLPFSELELENFLLRVSRTRRGVRRIDSPEMKAARVFGSRLYDAVFEGEVGTAYRRSLDTAERSGLGVRIRLRLGGAPGLSDLPWEFLFNEGVGGFLVLSERRLLVRYTDLPRGVRALAITPPLRVLMMVSSPSDFPKLDVRRERRLLTKALSGLVKDDRVELEVLEDATLGALQRVLRRQQVHVLHYIGHGGYDQQTEDGVLLLEDEQGRGRRVSGISLGTLLADHDPLRLVVLNACEGARTGKEDPFGGVAPELVRLGAPSVIAMQFEITDDAAIRFAEGFYMALADGYPVDAAVAEARKSVFAGGNDIEWATPVLYLRSSDGRIFDVTATAPQPPPTVETEAPPAATPAEHPPPIPAAAPAVAPKPKDTVQDTESPGQVVQPTDEEEGLRAGEEVSANSDGEARVEAARFPAMVSDPADRAAEAGPPEGSPAEDEPAQGMLRNHRAEGWWHGRRVALSAAIITGFLVLGGAALLVRGVAFDNSSQMTVTTSQTPTTPPTPTTGVFGSPPIVASAIEAHRIFQSPVLDGDLSEWEEDGEAWYGVHLPPEWEGPSPRWKLHWDEDNVYVAAELFDDDVTPYERVSFNFDEDREGEVSNVPDEDDYQLVLQAGRTVNAPWMALWEKGDGEGSFDAQPSTAVRIGSTTLPSDGLTQIAVEASVPWSDLGVDRPDGLMGFRFEAGDAVNATSRLVASNVPESSSGDPNTWGRIEYMSPVHNVYGLREDVARGRLAVFIVDDEVIESCHDSLPEGTVVKVETGGTDAAPVLDETGLVVTTLPALTSLVLTTSTGQTC